MHTKMQEHVLAQKAMQFSNEELTTLLSQIEQSMTTESAIIASTRIGVRQSLSDIQLAQFVGFLSVDTLLDPERAFQSSVFTGLPINIIDLT